jgi:hypothetical protein
MDNFSLSSLTHFFSYTSWDSSSQAISHQGMKGGEKRQSAANVWFSVGQRAHPLPFVEIAASSVCGRSK